MSEWQDISTAPRRKVRRQRVIVQLFGNDKWDRKLRVVAGYFEDDGRAIAMDETGHFPFSPRAWQSLPEPPK